MDPQLHQKPLGWRPFVYGGIAAIFAETCTFPIDTSKTRLQLQGEVVGGSPTKFSGGPYRGMLHALFTTARIEGLLSLYQGLSSALLRQCVYGTIKFGLYNHMKRLIFPTPKDETLAVNVILAMFAGGFSNAIANPADMLKIRMQAHVSSQSRRMSLTELTRSVAREEGLLAFYKGVSPTAARAAVVCGVELPVYDISKKWILFWGLLEDTKVCHFVASFTAGLCGALISNPIDVIRTRLLNQPRSLTIKDTPPSDLSIKVYSGSFDCLYHTVRNEGLRSLWKGFIPNWLRLGPWNIVFFMTFEQLGRLPL